MFTTVVVILGILFIISLAILAGLFIRTDMRMQREHETRMAQIARLTR